MLEISKWPYAVPREVFVHNALRRRATVTQSSREIDRQTVIMEQTVAKMS